MRNVGETLELLFPSLFIKCAPSFSIGQGRTSSTEFPSAFSVSSVFNDLSFINEDQYLYMAIKKYERNRKDTVHTKYYPIRSNVISMMFNEYDT